ALLNAGVEPSDTVVQKALTSLRRAKLEKTYTATLQTMVLCAAEPNKDMVLIGNNVRWHEEKRINDGPYNGAWAYRNGEGDNSNAQFAVLALYEAQLVGAQVKRETWEMAYDYWARTQNPDGSWGYHINTPGSGSMTCAGIAGLAISAAGLASGDATVEGGRIVCCRPHQDDDRLERAINWLGQRFSVQRNPRVQNSGQPALYYYLYGLERAGRLTARRFIGDHD